MYGDTYIRTLLMSLGLTERQFQYYVKVNSKGREDPNIAFWIHRYVLEVGDKYLMSVTNGAFGLEDKIIITKEMDDPYSGCVREAYVTLSFNLPPDPPAVLQYLQKCFYKHLVTHSKRK